MRAAGDDNQALAGLGRSGVSNWVQVGAATTWQRLSDDQRQRIHGLLDVSSLSDDQKRMVAFCAGIKFPERPRPVSVDYRSDLVKPRRRFGLFRGKLTYGLRTRCGLHACISALTCTFATH